MASVSDPTVVDLIGVNPSDGASVLVILQRLPWNGSRSEAELVAQKLEAYIAYVLSGRFARDNPKVSAGRVGIELRYLQDPPPVIARVFDVARATVEPLGLRVGMVALDSA